MALKALSISRAKRVLELEKRVVGYGEKVSGHLRGLIIPFRVEDAMPKTFEANGLTLREAFTRYNFKIPPFQRPYAWVKAEAEILFQDLFSAMDWPKIPSTKKVSESF
jgi:hypothetical protein